MVSIYNSNETLSKEEIGNQSPINTRIKPSSKKKKLKHCIREQHSNNKLNKFNKKTPFKPK